VICVHLIYDSFRSYVGSALTRVNIFLVHCTIPVVKPESVHLDQVMGHEIMVSDILVHCTIPVVKPESVHLDQVMGHEIIVSHKVQTYFSRQAICVNLNYESYQSYFETTHWVMNVRMLGTFDHEFFTRYQVARVFYVQLCLMTVLFQSSSDMCQYGS
jgi:hypothetical protein